MRAAQAVSTSWDFMEAFYHKQAWTSAFFVLIICVFTLFMFRLLVATAFRSFKVGARSATLCRAAAGELRACSVTAHCAPLPPLAARCSCTRAPRS